MIKQLIFGDEGATAVEYAVMLALILIACIGAVAVVGTETSDMWSDNDSGLQSAFSSGS